MSKLLCYLCSNPAVKLCDGLKVDGSTCDRPMCADHIQRHFPYIASIRGKGNKGSLIDSNDYCIDCTDLGNIKL